MPDRKSFEWQKIKKRKRRDSRQLVKLHRFFFGNYYLRLWWERRLREWSSQFESIYPAHDAITFEQNRLKVSFSVKWVLNICHSHQKSRQSLPTWVCPVNVIVLDPSTDHSDQQGEGDRRQEPHRCAPLPQDSVIPSRSPPHLKLWLMARGGVESSCWERPHLLRPPS